MKDGDFWNNKDVGQKLVMEADVCVLKKKGDRTPGNRLMSIDDVKANMATCKKVMTGWDIAALSDGKFSGEEYGFDFKTGDFGPDKSIGQQLEMYDD